MLTVQTNLKLRASVGKDCTEISNSTLFSKTLNMMPDAVLILNP